MDTKKHVIAIGVADGNTRVVIFLDSRKVATIKKHTMGSLTYFHAWFEDVDAEGPHLSAGSLPFLVKKVKKHILKPKAEVDGP